VNRHDPSERVWHALKQLAQREARALSEAEAIKRVKAVARREGAANIPDSALRFYADEYREMVVRRLGNV
jgi:hypothetical protein